jgi:hypothetical protein
LIPYRSFPGDHRIEGARDYFLTYCEMEYWSTA